MNRITQNIVLATALAVAAPLASAASFSLSNSYSFSLDGGLSQGDGQLDYRFKYNANIASPLLRPLAAPNLPDLIFPTSAADAGVTVSSTNDSAPNTVETTRTLTPAEGGGFVFSTFQNGASTFTGATTGPNQEADIYVGSLASFEVPSIFGGDEPAFDFTFTATLGGTATAASGETALVGLVSVIIDIYEGATLPALTNGEPNGGTDPSSTRNNDSKITLDSSAVRLTGQYGGSFTFNIGDFLTEFPTFNFFNGFTVDITAIQRATLSSTANAVPEPMTFALMLGGLCAVAGSRRVRRA